MPPQPGPNQTVKVVLVGDSGVGKSTILSSYRGERFNPCYVQTQEREIKNAKVQVGKESVDLQIWDTPGNAHCRTITTAYMQGDVKGVIVVFDVTSYDTYLDVQHWVKTVKQYAGNENVKFVFVGNKNDLSVRRKVLLEAGEELAKQHNGAYIDASAKKKDNIDKIFKTMAESILGVANNTYFEAKREPEPDDFSRSDGGGGGGGFRCTVL
ncbi:GTP-binding protein [Desmophyllum pertusum]|uniref:GTP-binding protein n=1 Tax=Desmophyllum pertusum TaxID=174260 RepID=A0A9X0A6I7_9CNID|nr:GTP-binding protein [Desmophyllum pertusum]